LLAQSPYSYYVLSPLSHCLTRFLARAFSCYLFFHLFSTNFYFFSFARSFIRIVERYKGSIATSVIAIDASKDIEGLDMLSTCKNIDWTRRNMFEHSDAVIGVARLNHEF